jgi:hypothetical protein
VSRCPCFFTAPPRVHVCGDVRMTREEQMGALCCSEGAKVMHELVHMQEALQYAYVQTAMAATMKRECEGRARAHAR